jgi:hypothetical protein
MRLLLEQQRDHRTSRRRSVFLDHVKVAFDFRQAIRSEAIERISRSSDCDPIYLSTQLENLRIGADIVT